jgi:uncharacterized damage-inducible protein DinB
MSDPRHPIGTYAPPAEPGQAFIAAAIDAIAVLPAELRAALAGLDDSQLDTPYRDGGWTVRQLAHHVPDSHMNAYVRHKLTITEERPTIRAYDEKVWAEQPEARTAPIEISLRLLEGLHARWAAFLRTLPFDAFAREFFHPEANRTMRLDWSVGMYAWHGRHHTAHVLALRQSRGW